jgi:hypothetical protein
VPENHRDGAVKRWSAFLTAIGACTLIACGLSRDEEAAVHRWLLCEECVDGELDSVVAFGNRAVPALDAALRGPPRDRYENVRPVHGSGATSTGGCMSIPFGRPLR